MLSHILNGPRSRLLALRFVLSVHPVCRRGCLRVEVLAELGFILGHEGAVTPIQDPANLPDQVPTASHGDPSGSPGSESGAVGVGQAEVAGGSSRRKYPMNLYRGVTVGCG